MGWFSKKGWKVIRRDRATFVYHEDGKTMQIAVERLISPEYDWAVGLATIQEWDPPHHHLPVTGEDRARIESNLRTTFSKDRVLWEDGEEE